MKQIQTAKGSRASHANVEQHRGWKTRVTPDLAEFLAGLDMFYLGTANAEGQPCIQYRGRLAGLPEGAGRPDARLRGFRRQPPVHHARQPVGEPEGIPPPDGLLQRQPGKVWGTAKVVEDDPELLDRLRDPEYPGKVERAVVFTVEAWDIN